MEAHIPAGLPDILATRRLWGQSETNPGQLRGRPRASVHAVAEPELDRRAREGCGIGPSNKQQKEAAPVTNR